MDTKCALIIGNREYNEPLSRLITPGNDATRLAEVLSDPDIGGFDHVELLLDRSEGDLRRTIERFYGRRSKDQLLLLYFSGHGVLDDKGLLYFAVKDTELDALRSTSVPATFVRHVMDDSRSRRQVLILDCCNSAAFLRGTKGRPGASVGTAALFDVTGYGRVVLTATDATQYAWEGDQLTGQTEHSVFTYALVRGLQTGEADENQDGLVTIDELYHYVYEGVIRATPKQTPLSFADKQQGHMVIARNPQVRIAEQIEPPRLAPQMPEPMPRPPVMPGPNVKPAAYSQLYTTLGHFLSGGKWKEADQETLDLILTTLGRQEHGWIRAQDIERLPCSMLQTVDHLWMHYSNRRFGFSVQKTIWRDIVQQSQRFDVKSFCTFGDRVGWRVDGEWLRSYHHLIFTPSAPVGHLPSLRFAAVDDDVHGWEVWRDHFKSFLARIDTCL